MASDAGDDDDDGKSFFSSTPPQSTAASKAGPSQQSLFRGDDDEDDDEEAYKPSSKQLADEEADGDYDPAAGHRAAASSSSRKKRSPSTSASAAGGANGSKRARAQDTTAPRGPSSSPLLMRRQDSHISLASTMSGSSSQGSSAYGQWTRRYIGNFVTQAYSLSKGSNYVSQGDYVSIQRQKPKAAAAAASSGKATLPLGKKFAAAGNAKKQTKLGFGSAATSGSAVGARKKAKEDCIVRFTNRRGFEVGRIPVEVAAWMAKVMDNEAACFDGVVVDCPPVLSVGCDILLEVRAYILRDAFTSAPGTGEVSFGGARDDQPAAATWGSETAESAEEKRLRERKVSLVRLFRSCTLRPSTTNAILSKHRSTEDLDSDAVMEQYGGASQVLNGKMGPAQSSSNGAAHTSKEGNKSRSTTPDVEDGTEVTEHQLDSVYDRAQLYDSTLPERDPADDFALTLRPYQKQALGWMLKMEERQGGRRRRKGEKGREETGLHPLWEEYIFPVDEQHMELLDTATSKFYFNPYTGHLSLKFQSASRGARGGILADEMGLGKTIQMASLILTNQPTPDEVSSDEDSDEEEEDATHAPRQISLATSFAAAGSAGLSAAEVAAHRKSMLTMQAASRGRVTLVIAPMSLVGQWRDEMERAIPTMRSMLYYAETKGDLVSRLEGGSVDIVITSYGTLITEYKKYLTANGNAAAVARNAPLYAMQWLRVILDEAHHIKNKATKNSRACRDLHARRRWCLTGTPIVNRLTDLYSLLRFLRVEPWGDFAFFNSFIAKPFMQKNPKALEIVQVVLESVLMRREKRMKDRDGKPIVELPPKTVHMVKLKFSPLERQIYESVYERAFMQYQSLAAAGTVSRNFTFIFSVLMRLRQAVCHPLLVLKKAKVVQQATDKEQADEQSKQASVLGEAEEKVSKLVAAFQAGANSIDEETDSTEKLSADVLEQLFGEDNGDAEDVECPFCFEEKSELLVMPCKHWGCKACVIDHLQRSEDKGEEEAACPTCRKGPVTLGNTASVVRMRRNRIADAIASSQEAANGKTDDQAQPSVYFRTNDLRSSTKLERLVEHLNQLRYDDPTFKGVIFSQFTTFLDLVEVVLRRNHHAFVRLDGTTSQKDREAVLKEFTTAPKRMLILISLRAGGVGLNLVAANHVWLLDCWWNSSTEDQATDRVHRLGQTRPVHVHRYLIDDSIEDRILAIQARKTALVGAALAGSRGPDDKSEALQNLELLFS